MAIELAEMKHQEWLEADGLGAAHAARLPFQAWSLAELIRLERIVLAE